MIHIDFLMLTIDRKWFWYRLWVVLYIERSSVGQNFKQNKKQNATDNMILIFFGSFCSYLGNMPQIIYKVYDWCNIYCCFKDINGIIESSFIKSWDRRTASRRAYSLSTTFTAFTILISFYSTKLFVVDAVVILAGVVGCCCCCW